MMFIDKSYNEVLIHITGNMYCVDIDKPFVYNAAEILKIDFMKSRVERLLQLYNETMMYYERNWVYKSKINQNKDLYNKNIARVWLDMLE